MTYKLLIVKNRYKKKLNFSKCFDWFKTNMDITITVEEIKTDFDLTTKRVGNAKWNGVVAGDDLTAKLRSVVPIDTYNAVVFMYGNNLGGVRLNCVNGGSDDSQNLYENTEVIQLVNTDWKILNHELFHAFYAKANRFGANLWDNMDTYHRDNVLDLNNGQTNRTIAVKNLLPYLKTITSFMQTTPTVTIIRSKSTTKETTGLLTAQNHGASFTCKTLELPWKNNASNISCIPTGTYQVTWSFSPSRLKYTYRVQNVPGRSGILFHVGNYFKDIKGCILLGSGLVDLNKDGELDVTNSTATIKAFEGFMGKKPFTLIIK